MDGAQHFSLAGKVLRVFLVWAETCISSLLLKGNLWRCLCDLWRLIYMFFLRKTIQCFMHPRDTMRARQMPWSFHRATKAASNLIAQRESKKGAYHSQDGEGNNAKCLSSTLTQDELRPFPFECQKGKQKIRPGTARMRMMSHHFLGLEEGAICRSVLAYQVLDISNLLCKPSCLLCPHRFPCYRPSRQRTLSTKPNV